MSIATPAEGIDVVVVGAGFAGLRALYSLRSAGHRVVVLEAADGVGGVWHWNRYPGARCDVESFDYSYSFSEDLQQEWRWSERYATQPEILRYLNHVADRFDLRPDIRLSTRLTSAVWDDTTGRWEVLDSAGGRWSARFVVMATGQLSLPKRPKLPGQEDFGGTVFHTGEWPQAPVSLAGQRVGIIGTGSSGMQMIPVVAQHAAHLTVFQRTANFSVPAANTLISDEEDEAVKAVYTARRERTRNSPTGLSFDVSTTSALEVSDEERVAHYEKGWPRLGFGFVLSYRDLLTDREANDTASEFIRGKIRQIVKDPATCEMLVPKDFPFGAKRPSVDSAYFDTFNRDNVSLVDVRADPIESITATGLKTRDHHYELDAIVFATGFDAFTGSLLKPEISGRGGRSLREHWSAGPRTYLGLMTDEFPNLFVIAGPGSPSLLSNVIVSTETHVDVIVELIAHLERVGASTVEPTAEAVVSWVAHVNDKAQETLYPQAVSYYNGDEVEGKPRVFMPYPGGVRGYRRIVAKVVENDYEGFVLAAATEPTAVGAR